MHLSVIGYELHFEEKMCHCAIGKGGFSDHKKEGDGATPLGTFALRECWYRADRIAAPKTGLPLKVIHQNDGWCDDPKAAEYNRHIKIPSPLVGEGGERSERVGGGFPHAQSLIDLPLPNPPPQGGREYSYERLWRDDHRYDLIVPLGYNDDPVVPGRGSAIFLHIAAGDYAPTEGCVALAAPDLLALLALCDSGTVMEIKKK